MIDTLSVQKISFLRKGPLFSSVEVVGIDTKLDPYIGILNADSRSLVIRAVPGIPRVVHSGKMTPDGFNSIASTEIAVGLKSDIRLSLTELVTAILIIPGGTDLNVATLITPR